MLIVASDLMGRVKGMTKVLLKGLGYGGSTEKSRGMGSGFRV